MFLCISNTINAFSHCCFVFTSTKGHVSIAVFMILKPTFPFKMLMMIMKVIMVMMITLVVVDAVFSTVFEVGVAFI